MKIVLIDGKNFAYRMHYTHISLSANGEPTGVIYGCLTGMLNLAKRLPDTAFVYVWDGAGKTWRHEIADSVYKANRQQASEEINQARLDVNKQISTLKILLEKMGFKNFEIPGLEGDDLIGILAKFIDSKDWFDPVIIHSTDKDFYQLLSSRIHVLKGIDKSNTDKLIWITPEYVREELGIPIEKCTHLKAITGEATDNIPQIFRGVGPKTAMKFIQAGCDPSVEEFEKLPKAVQKNLAQTYVIRKNVVNFKQNWDKVHLNWKLCKIISDPECEHFRPEVRKQASNLISGLKKSSFLRIPTDEGWDYMTKMLRRLEMEELYNRRQEIWTLL